MKKLITLSFSILFFAGISIAQPTNPGPDNNLDFDGSNDYANLGDSSTLLSLPLGDFTLEAWVKTTASGANQGVIHNYNGGASYGLVINSSGNLSFHCGFPLYQSTANVNDGEWHHCVVIHDYQTNILMYVDGIQVYSHGSDPVGAFSITEETWIGRLPAGFWAYQGSVDEVRIWNAVRSETQIRENMFNVLEGDESGLVAYYRFDESSGTNLPDIGPNGLDGTLNNMTDGDWVSSDAFNTWIGGTSSSWTTASNWSRNAVPSGENVGIFDFATGNSPNLSGSASIGGLYIGSGVSMTVSSDFSVSGDAFLNSSLSLPSSGSTSTISGDVYIPSGVSLSLQAGSQLTVTGNLNNAGTVSILSPSSNAATGSLITNGGILNTGTMTAQRWISAGDTSAAATNDFTWHSVSIPTANALAGNLFLWDRALKYNQTDNTFTNLEAFGDPILRGSGYLVKTPSAKTLNFTGTFNDGTYGFTLNNTGADASHGYNFVGNPYPSAIDLDELSRTNIGTTVWVFDPVAENYITHAIGGGASTLGQYIQPFQGFFMKVNSGSSSGNLTFDNADRVHYPSGTFYKKSAGLEIEDLVLKAKGNDKYDILYIKNRDAVNDSYKFFSWNPEVPMIFAKDNNTDFAIYNVNGNLEGNKVQLGYKTNAAGNFSIEVLEENFADYKIYLLDNKNSSETLLNPGISYDFSFNPALDEERFELLFTSSSLSSDDIKSDKFRIFASDMHINIWKSDYDNARVEVYDTNGRLIVSESSTSDKLSIPVKSKGIYLVKVISEGEVEVKKLGVF